VFIDEKIGRNFTTQYINRNTKKCLKLHSIAQNCDCAHNHIFALCGMEQHQNDIALRNFHPKPNGLKKQFNKISFISENSHMS
jgi:hypothetical protein